MKNVIVITLFLTVLSCSVKLHDYHSGIVIDELGRPLAGVLIRENSNNKYTNETITDKNGYFKFRRSGLSDIIISKENYLNDTIAMVWFQCEETYTYSPIITEDSSTLVIKGENISNLKLSYNDINKPSNYSINNFKFNQNHFFGVWLKNRDEELDGFKISAEELYALGYESFSSDRYLIYTINYDTILLYSPNYIYNLTGIIQKLDNENLEINWEGIGVEKYKKWRPD